jgi:supervillin
LYKKDGKKANQKDDIEILLSQLNRNRYPLSVLKQKPLPDGINPLKLECYLSDEEFEVTIILVF